MALTRKTSPNFQNRMMQNLSSNKYNSSHFKGPFCSPVSKASAALLFGLTLSMGYRLNRCPLSINRIEWKPSTVIVSEYINIFQCLILEANILSNANRKKRRKGHNGINDKISFGTWKNVNCTLLKVKK